MPELMKWITSYFAFRSLTWPNADRSLLFLVSEIGELSDAWVQEKAAWVRNNPDRERDVASEIGDVLMMLYIFADSVGVDPVQALRAKMAKKGFEVQDGKS
jgi:NTP pyrophosphatase (non-canonical NTP hydrolase)